MMTLRRSVFVDSPVETVFAVISSPAQFQTAVPHITNIEFVSEQTTGEGTRFVETRLISGREAKSTLEIVEVVENQQVRLVSDEGGTKWLSKATVQSKERGCELTLQLQADAYKFFAKIMNRIFKGMIEKALDADVQAVKEYCEKSAGIQSS